MTRVDGLDILQKLEEACDPRQLALVAYDMQIVEDACGSGHAEAAQRSVESLKFAGDAVFTDSDAFCRAIQHKHG